MRNRYLWALLALLPGAVGAQTLGTPVYTAPYRAFERSELGAAFSDPGSGVAVEGFYRIASGSRYDFGFRGGLRDNDPGDSQLLLGVDFRTSVLNHSPDFPLDGALTIGAGGQFGDDNSNALIPVGLSLGRKVALEDSEVELTVYTHPVGALTFGDHDTEVLFGLGFGVDVKITRRFEARFSAAIGDLDGVAIGFSILR